jgi:hypothetical protein
MSRFRMIAVFLAAAATAVLLNVVLLNSGASGNDPVGKLGPTANLVAQTQPLSTSSGVIQPSTGPIEGEDDDD